MSLINCIVELSLKWYENCILSSAEAAATFTITGKGFKRSIDWNKYKAIFTDYAANSFIREKLHASFQGVNKLFVLPYAYGNNITNENSCRRYFLPRLKMENYNQYCNLMVETFMINQLMT